MSFGGFGSGGGFGQTNNQQSTGFGGFGAANTNTTGGFGSTGATPFGATSTTAAPSTGGLFGGTTGSTAFGSGGGFGTAGGFGSKPAFGAAATTTPSGGLFGGGTTITNTPSTGFATSGFGSNTTSTTTPFGGGGGTTSLFGQNKPATGGFGASGGAFGTGASTTGGSLFGGGTAATAFGATNNPGIGAAGDPPGTAVVAFSPTIEKEANSSSQSNSFQNILFMDAYKKWSAEELRLVDYNQGRKLGSAGGTGAFGGSGFGTSGFGANTQTNTSFGGSTLFGGSQPATSGFGAPATNTGGFGASGGLFSKPATTGTTLFGGTAAQPAQTNMFGGGTTTGFGSTANTVTGGFGPPVANTHGAFFAPNASAKPTGFSFGNTGGGGLGTTGGTSGFGTNTTTANTGTGLFGGTSQTNTGGSTLFGNTQQQAPANTGFGASPGFGTQPQNTNTGLFGSQPKPGGLFGAPAATNTGGTGLFGGTANTSTPFGGTNTAQQQTGGLFGNKPATTGAGLFGGATTNQTGNTGGGLFGGLGGSNQTQQPAQGSLFGGLNQSAQQKPSLFGGQQPSGGSLFGGQQPQQQSSLFGNTNMQQAQGGLGGSLLGASQNSQAQAQSFTASITDLSAYGSSTLYSNLPDDRIQNPGPLATPLASKAKPKNRSILPMYKLSPANAASRFATPKRQAGFGFSYSNYGSPSSPSSVASTPGGLGQSLLLGRGLSKSISASSLRRSYAMDDSLLTPGAFSASTNTSLGGTTGNHKRLLINKDMRSDLFAPPPKEIPTPEAVNGTRKLSKRVSFDTSTTENTPQESATEAQPNGSTAPSNGNVSNGSKVTSVAATPEMEQIKGKELAIVHEEGSPAQARSKSAHAPVMPGEYWSSPPIEEIRLMNRQQLKKVNLEIGRENIGSVKFEVPVDLSGINLDELFDDIVILETRTATVYPNPAKKPPVGKGLNVPALISLEHSYPRGGLGATGRRLEKHIEKLQTHIPGTKFVNYDKETGVWEFTVEHFTTYGLSDDDDEDETEVEATAGAWSPKQAPGAQQSSVLKDAASPEMNPDDDTFDFKRGRRAVPGAFDEHGLSDDEDSEATEATDTQGVRPHHSDDAVMESQEWSGDESMAAAQDDYQYDAFQQPSPNGSIQEQQDELALSRFAENDVQVPAGIMRARMRAVKKSTAPTKIEVAGGDDWTQILQASVRAPRTVDRERLRALNESGAAWEMKDRGSPAPQNSQVTDGNGFATSIDLMKSLFEHAKGPTQPVQASPAKGFVKWPYQQRPKIDVEERNPVARPHWGPNEVLVTAHNNETNMMPVDGNPQGDERSLLSSQNLTRLNRYIDTPSPDEGQGRWTGPNLKDLAQGDPVWDVASLLFEEDGVNFPAFWKTLVAEATNLALAEHPSHEEKAIVCLAGNRVADACGHLLAAGDYRLASLVACIGIPNQDIRTQLKDWRDSNVLAEVSEPIRALYELLAGNAGVCDGVKNVPLEHRVASFVISERFGLNWMQAFALRLFYTTSKPAGSGGDVAEAVCSFQSDIEQGREPEPDSPLWSLLKVFADGRFDWSDTRLGWLLTRAIYTTEKVSFGQDAVEKLDRASVSFAATLTAQSHWEPAAFVLLQLSEPSSREAAVRDHLGRHAHLIGTPQAPGSPFSTLRQFGVPESWIWEAKALDFRSKHDSRQEFLALVWAGNYGEASNAFVHRLGPDLVIERDFKRLFAFAELLFKVRKSLLDWDRGAAVYLLYPMVRQQGKMRKKELGRFDDMLYDGLVALRGGAHGDTRQEAAIADMAEELIRCRGGDPRLYQLLPEDARARYMRAQALDNIR